MFVIFSTIPTAITFIFLLPQQVKKYPKNIYTCPCPGSGAKDMPSKEKVIT
ncbi:MAG TPA: hypothetical protein PL110_09600 [Candidatus Eremiobacteraeota bacterium]|nr:hypothetical protein [Candidatus Eremiobacteraeota bacterium]